MKNFISTDTIKKTDRADYWQDAVSKSFVALDCDKIHKNTDFFGHIDTCEINDLKCSQVTSTQQYVSRTKSLISKSTSDSFLLSLQVFGQGIVRQNNRDAKLQVGDLALYDTSKQYELLFDDDFSQIVLQIPRNIAQQYLGVPEKLTALKIDHKAGCSRITSQMIQSLYREGETLSTEQQNILLRSVMELLSANYRDSTLDIARNTSTTRYTRMVMIKEFIENNLTNYNLTPKVIADEFDISTRYLSKLFSEETTSVSKWLYEQRLEKCKSDMTNPLLSGLTISEIAFKWGYNDMSHFSRSFKDKFALSPREYRKIHKPTA